jgi:hypothetical protein
MPKGADSGCDGTTTTRSCGAAAELVTLQHELTVN